MYAITLGPRLFVVLVYRECSPRLLCARHGGGHGRRQAKLWFQDAHCPKGEGTGVACSHNSFVCSQSVKQGGDCGLRSGRPPELSRCHSVGTEDGGRDLWSSQGSACAKAQGLEKWGLRRLPEKARRPERRAEVGSGFAQEPGRQT